MLDRHIVSMKRGDLHRVTDVFTVDLVRWFEKKVGEVALDV